MNFFKFHLGDWARDCSHLTFLEDAAYSRLLRAYYGEEQPLPRDVRKCARLVRAMNPREHAAVKAVLAEFFELRRDGWHNDRADSEIAAAKSQIEANRRVALEREAKRRGESKGMQHDSLESRARTVHEPSTNRGQVVHESKSVRSPIHKPLATIQTKNKIKNPKPRPGDNFAAAPEGTERVLDELESILRRVEFIDSSQQLEQRIGEALRAAGAVVEPQFRLPDRGDGNAGLVDFRCVLSGQEIGIEADRASARQKSIAKLQSRPWLKVVVLRTASAKPIAGIDRVIALGKLNGQAERAASYFGDIARLKRWASEIGCELKPEPHEPAGKFEERIEAWRKSRARPSSGPQPVSGLLK